MVLTCIGWIDCGDDDWDDGWNEFNDKYYRLQCVQCGSRINTEPQEETSQYIRGYTDDEWIDVVYRIWWECPRCMSKYYEVDEIIS